MKRREFIRIPAQALGGVLMYTLACEPVRLPVETSASGTLDFELRHFTAAQAHVVQAASARIFPNDDSGPGATAFPRAGSTKPTLTALAVTYRAADALIDRYLKRPGLVG